MYGVANATMGMNYGVYGQSASTSGTGVYGLASATTGVNFGVYGVSPSTSGTGVYGLASATTGSGTGVYGESYAVAGSGLYGRARATTGTTYGVIGESDSTTHGYGVFGYSSSPWGINYGVSGTVASTMGAGVYGGGPDGVFGRTASPTGTGVYGQATATTGPTVGVYGETESPDGWGVFSWGNMGATGTKSAIVETQDYGWRNLYAMESPQNWFEDFGQATLTAGETVVPIEEVFAQTVNLDKPYHVFLTPQDGFCSLYVTDKSPTSFTVRAVEGSDCEVAFDYRIIAPRLNYEDLRLKEAESPEAVAASLPAAPAAP